MPKLPVMKSDSIISNVINVALGWLVPSVLTLIVTGVVSYYTIQSQVQAMLYLPEKVQDIDKRLDSINTSLLVRDESAKQTEKTISELKSAYPSIGEIPRLRKDVDLLQQDMKLVSNNLQEIKGDVKAIRAIIEMSVNAKPPAIHRGGEP